MSLRSYRDQLRSDLEFGRLLRFGAIAAQFALIVAAFRLTNIETDAIELILMLALGGFLVHHFLPAVWRLRFFAALSVASVPMVFGWEHGAWLLGMGGLLIALCHLPVALWARVVLVLLTAGAMAAARVHVLPWLSPQIPGSIWPILGAMFMFRLMVYLYDLEHGTVPRGVARALSYFFMLPNVCFQLLPVVDYKTLQRSVYNEDALQLYQTGVNLMLRGLVHIVLYKIVYFRVIVDPVEAVSGMDAGRYMFGTFLLYLRISGLFHLIAGLLHMYGYGLPVTHHLYLFSSSFTDLWRRINIYWKDFIQKLVFNPAYFMLRKLGDGWAITLATFIAFALTWFFHSYQWFWIRGEFPILWSDLVFWFGLALVVRVTLYLEARNGRRRSLGKQAEKLREKALLALKIAGTFASVTVMWTIWSTPKLEELGMIWRALLTSGPLDLAMLLGVPIGIGVLGALFGDRKREVPGTGKQAGAAASAFWPRAVVVSMVAGAIVYAAVRPSVLVPVWPGLAKLVNEVRLRSLDPVDTRKLPRGYKEELGDLTRFNYDLWVVHGGRPKHWDHSPQARGRSDAIGGEYIPSTAQVFKGVLSTINSHGMRDREYALERGQDTFRIALIGAAHDAGDGVKDNETYENLIEDRLNRELGPRTGKKFEILNFSGIRYNPIQKLAVIEQRVFQFQPDVILYVANSRELEWMFNSIPHMVANRYLDQFPFIKSALERVDIKPESGRPLPDKIVLDGKLAPFVEDALRAVLQRFREGASSRGARPAMVILEVPENLPVREAIFDRIARLGQLAGLPVLDLQGSFASVKNRKSLWIAPWDYHTNAEGHRLLADRLYALLLKDGLVPVPTEAPVTPQR